MTKAEDSPGKYSEAHSKGSLSFQPSKDSNEEARGSISQEDSAFLQEELARRRELALRQHAFFQLRLHIRRGMNLVAMDRCGEIHFLISLFYFFRFSLKNCYEYYFELIQIFIQICISFLFLFCVYSIERREDRMISFGDGI